MRSSPGTQRSRAADRRPAETGGSSRHKAGSGSVNHVAEKPAAYDRFLGARRSSGQPWALSGKERSNIPCPILEYFPLGSYPCGVEHRRAQGFADFADTSMQEAPARRPLEEIIDRLCFRLENAPSRGTLGITLLMVYWHPDDQAECTPISCQRE